MYLKEINLKGFKSFPDRTRLSFSQGVSVIVGPNGCGKSNITDAVLWALGEQSPLAVRGQSMRDVIFAGGQGQSRRRFAEVEVVIDNSEGLAASEFSEISITRRIERNGDGEYRLNGARCRLADVVEVLSDTNMGREMHSVISQGRVEAIVNSKPRDRRLLVEEAAGLGKHRKRRHRSQLKLERTRENLDRALDVEREARSRLRPLKRQAEAAERTAKLVAQEAELRAVLVAGDLRSHEDELSKAELGLTGIREKRDQVEGRLEQIRERRSAIEERVALGEDARREQSQRLADARGALERVRARSEAIDSALRDLRSGMGERQLRLDQLDEGPEIGGAAAERVKELEAALAALSGEDGQGGELAQLRRQAAEAEGARAEAEAAMPGLAETAEQATAAFDHATQARDQARAEAGKAAERRAALEGELAAVEAKLARAAMEGGDEVLGGQIETGPGIERALSAALGERLRAAVVASIDEGVGKLDDSDGASRALIAGGESPPAPDGPPVEGARRLLDLVDADGAAREVAERLLADAWLVDELSELPQGFRGIAVTVDGDAYDGGAGELRRLPREGTDPALAARSAREELASRLEQRRKTEERATNDLERAEDSLAGARAQRDQSDHALREARRRLDEAAEEARRATWLADRRAERDEDGAATVKRARLEAELEAERRHVEASQEAAEARLRDQEELRQRIELERRTLPALERAGAALGAVAERLERHADALGGPAGDDDGGEVAAELRECSQQEYGLQAEMREVSEALTTAEVEASQLRQRRDEGRAELQQLGTTLERELAVAERPLPDSEREQVEVKLQRVGRRREQIGPVNPLAEREYAEESEHVKDLATQRKDMEAALAELRSLIRRIDKEIADAFEQTFESTARNFEEMVAELFPGGRGRLRRIDVGPKPVTVPQSGDGAAPEEGVGDEETDDYGTPRDEAWGVEIEVTPAGKSTRRLSLLSGGEKSLVALAFVFAVLMARPCPFYILDEVEAALDDINIDRFLRLVRRFSERSQFIVVTHQKRTMDAADILYGVSMGGDGITKVVSRRLPRDGEIQPGDVPEADAAAAEAA